MQLRTRVSFGTFFAASAVAATLLAWHARRDCPAPPPPAPPPPQATAPQVVQVPVLQTVPGPAPECPEDLHDCEPVYDADVSAGAVELAWMPKGYVQDLPADKAEALVTFARNWLDGDGEPSIEYRRGVVFVQSREDRADDGPYPRSAEPEGQRVCGTEATWLRRSLEKTLKYWPLACSRNVCWYGGTEYSPSGYLVFREYTTVYGDQTWALDAWIEVYEAGLGQTLVANNYADVTKMMTRLASTSCAGEPAGAY
jgi:hypothetical protein